MRPVFGIRSRTLRGGDMEKQCRRRRHHGANRKSTMGNHQSSITN
jgi:hypothetical protein